MNASLCLVFPLHPAYLVSCAATNFQQKYFFCQIFVGNSHQQHGSAFNIDCNSCSCYAGELVCSKRQCESSAVGGRNTAYTTLPCNCPPHYVPVCGRNGITYPSACLAKYNISLNYQACIIVKNKSFRCAGLHDADIEILPCQNPCKSNSCPVGQKCVPKQQTCLSLMHKPCKQYECGMLFSSVALKKS